MNVPIDRMSLVISGVFNFAGRNERTLSIYFFCCAFHILKSPQVVLFGCEAQDFLNSYFQLNKSINFILYPKKKQNYFTNKSDKTVTL